MRYLYRTNGTCSTRIEFDIDDDIITNVQFTDGCPGNLLALPILVDGMSVEEIEKKLGDVRCGRRGTSCAHQLSLAVREAYEKTKNKNY